MIARHLFSMRKARGANNGSPQIVLITQTDFITMHWSQDALLIGRARSTLIYAYPGPYCCLTTYALMV